MNMTFPASTVSNFRKVWNYGTIYKGMRYGQAFHTYFKLDQIELPENKQWCDLLYQMDEIGASMMIMERIDWEN